MPTVSQSTAESRLQVCSQQSDFTTAVHVAALFAMTFGSASKPALAQGDFEGSVTFGFEVERKTCTSCDEDEHDNEIKTTPLELVLRSKMRPELTFGLELEYDVENEGGFFGSDRTDVESQREVTFWARQRFNENFWARMQGEWNFDEDYVDLGGRIGFGLELEDDQEISGYWNVDRRIATSSKSVAENGTYLEVRAEHEWDFDEYGTWVELKADRWFYDGDRDDETRLTFQPGIWFELGDSPHNGLLWVEHERRTRNGSDEFQRDTLTLGIGAELDLGNRREMMIGFEYGKESESELGEANKNSRTLGLIMEIQTRF